MQAAREARAVPGAERASPVTEGPDLLEWLHAGRLSLINGAEGPISPEKWYQLPSGVQARALDEFQNVVRGRAKAAVIFLRAE
jgi:hypothetical protein